MIVSISDFCLLTYFVTMLGSNQPAQLQRLARILKFCMKEVKLITFSNNKGADQPAQMQCQVSRPEAK